MEAVKVTVVKMSREDAHKIKSELQVVLDSAEANIIVDGFCQSLSNKMTKALEEAAFRSNEVEIIFGRPEFYVERIRQIPQKFASSEALNSLYGVLFTETITVNTLQS